MLLTRSTLQRAPAFFNVGHIVRMITNRCQVGKWPYSASISYNIVRSKEISSICDHYSRTHTAVGKIMKKYIHMAVYCKIYVIVGGTPKE